MLLALYRKRFFRGAAEPLRLKKRTLDFFACQSLLWREWVTLGRKAKLELGADFVHEVKFEDFVAHPETTLKQICRAVGINYDRSMLDKTRRQSDPIAKPEFNFAHSRITQEIDPSCAQRGKELPPWATYVVERFAKGAIKELGYKTNEVRVHPLAKLVIAAGLRLMNRGIRRNFMRAMQRRSGASSIFQIEQPVSFRNGNGKAYLDAEPHSR